MRFREWINNENYKKIEEYCINCCTPYKSVNYCDVLSKISENITNLNPILDDEKKFLNGILLTNINWAIKELLKKSISDKIPDKKWEEFDENKDNFIENRLKSLKNSQYWNLYEDRYLHKMNRSQLSSKYNVSKKVISDRLEKIRNMIGGKAVKNRENTYKGIARIDSSGKIIKVYPHSSLLINDGFERATVSKCCNGKIKTHKGYIFKFIKDLENESKRMD